MSHQKLINQQGNTSTSSSSSAGGCGGGGDAESIILNKESFPSISLKEKFTQMISNNFQKIPPFRIKWFISTIAIVIYSTIFNITNLIMFSKFTKNFNLVNPLP